MEVETSYLQLYVIKLGTKGILLLEAVLDWLKDEVDQCKVLSFCSLQKYLPASSFKLSF